MTDEKPKLKSPFSEKTLKVRRNLLFACTGGLCIKTFGVGDDGIKILKMLIDATPEQTFSVFSVFIFYLFFEWVFYSIPEAIPWLNENYGMRKTWRSYGIVSAQFPQSRQTVSELDVIEDEIESKIKTGENLANNLFKPITLVFDICIPTLLGFFMCIYFTKDLLNFITSAFKALLS